LPRRRRLRHRCRAARRRRAVHRLPRRVPAPGSTRPMAGMSGVPSRGDETGRPDIIGLGEAMVLFQPPAGAALDDTATLEVHVAGAEFNLCAAAARLGATTGFCSRVGADPLGARVLAEARTLGVDTTLVMVDEDQPTGLFLKDVRPDGRRRVYYYRRGSAASQLDRADAA